MAMMGQKCTPPRPERRSQLQALSLESRFSAQTSGRNSPGHQPGYRASSRGTKTVYPLPVGGTTRNSFTPSLVPFWGWGHFDPYLPAAPLPAITS